MGRNIDKILSTSIIIYIIIIISIIIMKPTYLYDTELNKFKNFGAANNETMLPITLFSAIIAIIIYLCVMLYNVLLKLLS